MFYHVSKRIFVLFVLFVLGVYGVRALVPPPSLVASQTPWRPLSATSELLIDTSWVDQSGTRQLQQHLFDVTLDYIKSAEKLILVDWFLFNEWQGPEPENHRALTAELTDALIAVRSDRPEVTIIVITDPVNTVYGGVIATHLESFKAAGIHVVLSPLVALQDSHPVYSAIWRRLIRPFGNSPQGGWLPNPFGEGKVTLRSYFSLLNFKANHRKLLITDAPSGGYRAIVGSANPHDGSSAHRNIGMSFDGLVAADLLELERQLLLLTVENERHKPNGENAVAALAQLDSLLETFDQSNNDYIEASQDSSNSTNIRVITESAILRAVVAAIDTSVKDNEVDIVMFYLSHRKIVKALKRAAARGVRVRLLLDANKDAFGREKGGIPNRPVAAELVASGVSVRWCVTQGEQCHAKAMLVKKGDHARLILGSGNYTRRNLDDYNLETNIDIKGALSHAVIQQFIEQFNLEWSNTDERIFSVDYERFAQNSVWKRLIYRAAEATGISTF